MLPIGVFQRLSARFDRVEAMLSAICKAADLKVELPPLPPTRPVVTEPDTNVGDIAEGKSS